MEKFTDDIIINIFSYIFLIKGEEKEILNYLLISKKINQQIHKRICKMCHNGIYSKTFVKFSCNSCGHLLISSSQKERNLRLIKDILFIR